MFTGLVEQVGTVLGNWSTGAGNRLVIQASFDGLQAGDSIAVNGSCLTWLAESSQLSFDLSPETLSRTTLGDLIIGDQVNLERAMLASTRFGGHYVCGHVNTIATVSNKKMLDEYLELKINGFSPLEQQYLIPKGSITLDGVSLTINKIDKDEITLMIVPHTLDNTTIPLLERGKKLNIEFDYIASIVAHQLNVLRQLG